jgi:hypothetical protein
VSTGGGVAAMAAVDGAMIATVAGMRAGDLPRRPHPNTPSI